MQRKTSGVLAFADEEENEKGYGDLDRSEVISHACGTHGYCEPEYVNTGIVTKESDVYSFGMEKRLDEIVDPSLKGEVNLKSLKSFAAIAYGCLHDDRKQRPSISHVLKELESLKTLHISQNESHEVGSSSRSYSKLEIRDKVKRVFQRFDRNKDGGLNKEELEALILATNSHLKYSSQEQINRELDKVFHLYDKFIDGEKGLTYDGLLRIYDEDGDIDRDFEEFSGRAWVENSGEVQKYLDGRARVANRFSSDEANRVSSSTVASSDADSSENNCY
ncbi:hypothetical protein QVD17_36296 [Tagetes erecta]|uniref:EF-hand domain-containing protein n=1 Tax=Tagetes erecta TaxID=13708 RepID=A0AAD8JW25_TARER|nr:hypothetical protein QVD17_36296 [Tagetes erecta]